MKRVGTVYLRRAGQLCPRDPATGTEWMSAAFSGMGTQNGHPKNWRRSAFPYTQVRAEQTATKKPFVTFLRFR
jgi:hypothetical protein